MIKNLVLLLHLLTTSTVVVILVPLVSMIHEEGTNDY